MDRQQRGIAGSDPMVGVRVGGNTGHMHPGRQEKGQQITIIDSVSDETATHHIGALLEPYAVSKVNLAGDEAESSSLLTRVNERIPMTKNQPLIPPLRTLNRRTRVIAVGNQKGGVGKTTNTVHIARALVEMGQKVLIIDLDMNHGATRHFGVIPEAYMGSYEMLAGDEEAANLVLTHEDEDISLPENLHLIPAARKLEGIDTALAQKSKFITPREVLLTPLEGLRGHYDYIFLDTAPNATLPTVASYLSADYFILSAMPDPFAIAGLNDALADISDAQSRGNPKLTLLGVVLSGVDKRTSLANSLSAFVEKAFQIIGTGESLKFQATISRSTVIPQTQKVGKTLFETHSTHRVTDEYRALAREIHARLHDSEQAQELQGAVNG